MNLDLAYSRPQLVADHLGDLASDRHRFLHKRVLLTGEVDVLATENGARCFLDSIRLLVRICPNITIVIPTASRSLLDSSKALARRITFGKDLEFRDEIGDVTAHDAILSVGAAVKPELPWTTINSNGWVARVSSGDRELPRECGLTNPVGALAAACLGAGEVFKRLIRLKRDRGELLNGFSYSLRTYRHDIRDCGPALPGTLDSHLIVVGAGAIGNGLVHLASRLGFSGRITIVDSQEYGEENLGTCILIGPSDLHEPKAETLAQYLRQAKIDARGYHMPFEQYSRQSHDFAAIVANGVDNIDARHEIQRDLWPDVIIDGAIGDFMCQVSRHPWRDDIACLICLFRKPEGKHAEDLQNEETGLSHKRVMCPEVAVTESDVQHAPAAKQDFLRLRIGRSICSVIQEAIALKLSTEKQVEGFEPSVPFVACFSACMVMAETVAHICDWPSILGPRFQFDFLLGPAHGQELPQRRRTNCICGRRKNIDALRAARKSSTTLDQGITSSDPESTSGCRA